MDRTAPGQELNTGEPTTPRPAATAIVVRDGAEGLEVLLVQRNPKQHFMGGAWVFPGGAVHDDDPSPAAAAVRELAEEAGIEIADPDALVPYARWITPREVRTRFDTLFFVAAAPPDAEVRIDGSECVDHCWIRPADALAAGARGELLLVFPTIKTLERLAELGSVDDALAAARARDVEPVLPKVLVENGEGSVVLPGEPGYEGLA